MLVRTPAMDISIRIKRARMPEPHADRCEAAAVGTRRDLSFIVKSAT